MRPDVSGLRERFRGSVITAYDPAYEAARSLFNTRVRTRPAVLCECGGTEDVVEAVRFAREQALPISVRSGGHHAAGFSLAQDGLVVDLRLLKGVEFDPGAGTVVVGAGCGWRDIDRVTYGESKGAEHGLAGPGGECPTVGSGYSLGGGYGLLSRTYGLGCDHIVAAEVVDADGRVLRAAEDENADLVWALRGAGGAGLGVVTRLTYRLDPVPRTAIGGAIAWPIDQAEPVLRAYRDLYTDRDEDRLALFLVLLTEPYPEGEPAVMIYGMYVGPPAEGERQLARLRCIGRPLYDGFAPTSYYNLQTALGQEVPYGLQSKWCGGYFRPGGFDDDAFAIMLEAMRRMPSGYSMVRFDLLGGGAIARMPAEATAFVHRKPLFYASIIGLWERDEDAAANMAWARELKAALAPYLTGEVYQNYADDDLSDWATAYYGSNYPRLQQVKQRYDPSDFFHHQQSIRLPA